MAIKKPGDPEFEINDQNDSNQDDELFTEDSASPVFAEDNPEIEVDQSPPSEKIVKKDEDEDEVGAILIDYKETESKQEEELVKINDSNPDTDDSFDPYSSNKYERRNALFSLNSNDEPKDDELNSMYSFSSAKLTQKYIESLRKDAVFAINEDQLKISRRESERSQVNDFLAAYTGTQVQSKHFPLYNSGFWISLRTPTIDELLTFSSRIGKITDYIAMISGGLIYYFIGHKYKIELMDFIHSLVVNSTLHNYDRKVNFLRNVSYHDIDVLVMYLIYTMYPNGYDNFTHLCELEGDKVHETIIKADVLDMVYTNFSKLPYQCKEFMKRSKTQIVREEELENYKRMLFENNIVTYQSDEHKKVDISIDFKLKDYSLYNYREESEKHFSSITNELSDSNSQQDLNIIINATALLAFYPAVSEIILKRKDIEQSVVNQKKDLYDLLKNLIKENQGSYLIDAIIDGMLESKMTHICYPTTACEKCSELPKPDSGFYVLDPLNNFFTIMREYLSG